MVSLIVFADRADAGRRLGARLAESDAPSVPADAVVLGIPRGGVAVAAEVARALAVTLGVAVARKIRAPGHPELALGAVGPDGAVVVDELLAARVGADSAYLEGEVARQRDEVDRRLGSLPPAFRYPSVRDRVVIVVDDGVATGATAAAAGLWLARAGARRRIVALPVSTPGARERLLLTYDDVLVLDCPEDLHAVGQAYADFSQTTDAEVDAILRPEG